MARAWPLAFVASLAVGCTQPGTAVLLTLTGAAGGADTVTVLPTYDGRALAPEVSHPAGGAPLALPATVTVELPDRAATVSLAVVLSAGGQPLLRGASDAVAVRAHQTTPLSLALGFCGGPSACAAGVTCAGFERGVVDAPFHPRALGSGSAAVETTRACRGAAALHLTTEPFPADTNVYATTFEQAVVPSPGAPLYVRAFFFVPAAGALQGTTTALEAYQSQAPFCGVGLRLAADGSYFATDFCGASAAESARPAAPFPVGRWVCVEQEIVSGPAGQVRTWIDDAAVPELDLDGVDTQPSPPLDSVNVGIVASSSSAAPPAELWVDEVMVDGARIGCAK